MSATATPRLYVDGHNLLHRAAFGFPSRITSRGGRDITLVFGFFALVRAGARSLPAPPEVTVVFDGKNGAVERRSLLPGYKPPVDGDEEAFADLPYIYKGLDLLGVRCVQDDRWEADDVIATLITRDPQVEHVVMSTDKDFYQLDTDHVTVLHTARRADQRRIGPHQIHAKHGVAPLQWCDYRALTGDKADNIPGIGGIGDRTAQRLLTGGARLEDLDKLGRLTGRVGHLVHAQWEDLLPWRGLIRLHTDVPVSPLGCPPGPTSLPPAAETVGELNLWT